MKVTWRFDSNGVLEVYKGHINFDKAGTTEKPFRKIENEDAQDHFFVTCGHLQPVDEEGNLAHFFGNEFLCDEWGNETWHETTCVEV